MSPNNDPTPASRQGRTRVAAAVVGALVIGVALTLALGVGPGDDPVASDPQTTAGPSPAQEPTGAPEPTASAPGSDGPAEEPETDPPSSSSPSAGPTDTGAADTRAPVQGGLREIISPAEGLTVQIVSVEPVRSSAEIPGETSRPSLRITVRIDNDTAAQVDTNNGLANLYYGAEREPANTSDRPGGSPFPRSVAPGESVTGVFVFNVPQAERGDVELEVSIAAQIRRVAFSGDCSQGC